jgi:glutathione S-transferase
MVAAMTLTLIELYPSPWSERLRWALDAKGLAYDREEFLPIAGEAAHRVRTGIATAPVLLADGDVIGDSDAALDWLEARHPTPALLPDDPTPRAAVRALEVTATEVVGPFARLVSIGRWKAAGMEPLASHFGDKYGWSETAEARGARLLGAVLRDLARAVAARPYLVGDTFTRADLTVASLLAAPLGHPPDELFVLDPGMRPLFGIALADEPALAPLRPWRDAIYRRHRGRRVTPA